MEEKPEINEEIAQNPPALNKSEKHGSKQGNGSKIAIAILAILALAGIGFGVYEMLQANQAKQQLSDLKIEVKNADGSTTTLETDKIEVKDDIKTVVITDSTAINPEEYIYLGQYGIKIKIPDTIKSVTYATSKYGAYIGARSINDASENVDFRDDFSNLLYNPYGVGAFSIVDNPDKCAMGEIDVEGDPGSGIRCKIVVKNSAGKEIGIRYEHPQAVYATSEDQKKLEVEAVGLVEKWLQDVSVYSAI